MKNLENVNTKKCENISPELSEICGIHAGDGYLRKRNNTFELDISGNIEEKEYYDNHVIPLFNKQFNLDLQGRYFSRGTYGFVTYNRELCQTLYNLGFPFGKKSKIVKIPNLILQSNDINIMSLFIRGIFDTDGHLSFRKFYGKNYSKFKSGYHNYPRIQIGTISKDLIDELSRMLIKLDIQNFVLKYIPKRSNENERYTVYVNGIDRLEKWMNIIGTKNYSKYSRYLIWKKYLFCPTNISFKQREDILNGKLDIYSLGPVV